MLDVEKHTPSFLEDTAGCLLQVRASSVRYLEAPKFLFYIQTKFPKKKRKKTYSKYTGVTEELKRPLKLINLEL